MSERVKKTTAPGKGKVTKAKSVSVKPGIKSTPVKRSGCFKERPVKAGKKSAKKAPRPKPGYSLYSSDSEDQITSLNCGIDKCSELLANLIQRKKGNQWTKPEIMLSQVGNENRELVSLVMSPRVTPRMQPRDRVFIPTAGTESPDTQVANMVDGRLARSRAPLVEVRTPFNQRLVSSTPDPERNVEEDDGYAQLIPEKDTNPSDGNRDRFSSKTEVEVTLVQQKVVHEMDVKTDKNQNYIKEGEHFEKGFRPVSMHGEEDFIEGVKRFEDSFPICHNRKSSIGDFQYYLQRESTGFSPPLFPSSQEKQTEVEKPEPSIPVRFQREQEGSVGSNRNEGKKDQRPRQLSNSEENSYSGSKGMQNRIQEPESHNRDYLDPDHDPEDQQEAYSAPVFNSMQVKMFGPGYRRRSSKEEFYAAEDVKESVPAEPNHASLSQIDKRESHQYNLAQKMDNTETQSNLSQKYVKGVHQYSLPHKADRMDTQYDLSQKVDTKHHSSWSEKVPHAIEDDSRFKLGLDRPPQDIHLATPMPSPARHLHGEPRAILGRHVGKNQTPYDHTRMTSPIEQVEQHLQSEDIFVNYDNDPRPDHQDWTRESRDTEQEPHSGRHVQFHLSREEPIEGEPRENYPSSLINPSTLNSNVCISKPVASQLPMLETPANSPVSHVSRNVRDLREVTLRKAARESAQGHEPHLFAENIRPHRGVSDNLERRFQEEANLAPALEDADNIDSYDCETAPFQPDLADHPWTMTPVNSPAQRLAKDSKLTDRTPATPAVNPAHRGQSSHLGHTPAAQSGAGTNQPQGQAPLPSRLDAVAGPRKLRYLLKELGEVCKLSGESELQYVVEDIHECMESIPQLKPTFNLQTEIDLLLQPLRSENSQLRRRLRIVNQQLKERERQEKENTNHGINFEMLHLQTDNASLQRQLKEEKETSHRLSQEMERLKYERQRMIIVLSDKENDATRIRDQCMKENQKLQFELDLAQKQTEGNHLRHAASESENRILQVSLKQRDIEINRLQELVQTLKDGVGEVLRSLDGGCHAGPTDSSFSLQKMLLLLNKQDAGFSPAKSVMSDPGQPTTNQEVVSSAKKTLQFDKQAPSSSRKSKVSPLSKEALHQHNKILHKETSNSHELASLEKEFRSYMSPFNSSPKSDRGSVTEMLLRNCSTKSRESRNAVRTQTAPIRQVTKLPQPNFDTSDSGLETEGTPGAVSRPPPNQAAPQDSSSLQSEAFKGTELDLSLSTIEEDVRSVVSAVTSTTSLSTVDDKAFRDGIAALDANIAKVLSALEKTKKMFS